MKKFFTISAVCLGVAFLFLWITNPTIRDFKDFIPTQTKAQDINYKQKVNVSKKSNYFIYSVYEYEVLEDLGDGDFKARQEGQFTGFMSNFFCNRKIVYPQENYY